MTDNTQQFKHYGEYIKHLCKEKQVTLKQVCEDLNYPYISFKSTYARKRMRPNRRDAVMDYLGGSSRVYDSLPGLND